MGEPRTTPSDSSGWVAAAPGAGTPRLGGPARGRRAPASPSRTLHPLCRTLPRTCARIPFTLGYTLLLIATSLYADLGDPAAVHALRAGSSTDVSHLADRPLLVLPASGAWVVGGIRSPYLLVFLLVMGALERRIGGLRAAGIFLFGHVGATMLTELPVAVSVAVGHLPASSLRRMDYGISYGLLAGAAALAGLLRPRVRAALLAAAGVLLGVALVRLSDPVTDWGHLLALLAGLACWPRARRAAEARARRAAGRSGGRAEAGAGPIGAAEVCAGACRAEATAGAGETADSAGPEEGADRLGSRDTAIRGGARGMGDAGRCP
ncbi:rhomboid-like protein [Streptomyces palmae]|uniref:rhomboid-like protein n=1 Tax=Streptomyces palmae TaxID=1701085 RepID=UPI001ADFDF49|nr:rhomboid-like protein [Streptomyces palmae]